MLFSVQVVIAFIFRDDPARAMASLTTLGWAYIVMAVPLYLTGMPGFVRACRELGAAATQQKTARASAAKTGSIENSRG